MAARQRSEAILTAVLLAAAVLSFLAAYRGWEGTMDTWFYLCMSLGAVFVVLTVVSISLLFRTVMLDRQLRVPLISVTRDEFRREPPIGKRPHRIRCLGHSLHCPPESNLGNRSGMQTI
jgi:uncharacterized membrane protein YhdT